MGPGNLGCRTAGQGQGLLDLAPPKAAETAVCSGFIIGALSLQHSNVAPEPTPSCSCCVYLSHRGSAGRQAAASVC